MSTVVYGLFHDAKSAERARQNVEAMLGDDPEHAVVLHTGRLRQEEVQLSGSEAVKGAVLGGLVVGLAGALIAAFAIGPLTGFQFGLETIILAAIGGSIFGVVAGVVAGASECKPAIAAHAKQVASGRTLVTCEVARGEVEKLEACLQDSGAIRVEAA